MINDGYVPGAFFVSVDKTDGHIWTRGEKENYYQQKSIPELQTAQAFDWSASVPLACVRKDAKMLA